jgi:hypothetical protein
VLCLLGGLYIGGWGSLHLYGNRLHRKKAGESPAPGTLGVKGDDYGKSRGVPGSFFCGPPNGWGWGDQGQPGCLGWGLEGVG